MAHPQPVDELNQGIVLARYTRGPGVQLFFILFFICLFVLGADMVFFRRIITDAPPLKVYIAAILDMIVSVVLLVFLVRRAILNRLPLAVTDRGIMVRFMDFRTINTFIPWNKITGISTAEFRVQLVYKHKYLVLHVEPGFPLPKQGINVLNLPPNALPVELNHLSRRPEEILHEVSRHLAQFTGRS